MLKPTTLSKGDIMATGPRIYRLCEVPAAYGARRDIRHQNEEKSEIQRSERHDVSRTPDGLMEVRIQNVEFVKQIRGGGNDTP